MKILITGAAGFIGYNLATRLLKEKHKIIGIDNINDFYDVNLKNARLDQLKPYNNFSFHKMDIADKVVTEKLFADNQFDCVINLAAQAGVRHSIEHPHSYIDSNVVGFINILEGCRHSNVKHLIYASTSSVYGANTMYPCSEKQPTEHPITLYAATKKTNELMAHNYATLFNLPCTGLRFFTVYGPWGRPDMALFKFTKNIVENKPIDVYNNGDMIRDFTYVDDIVEGIVRVMKKPATPNPNWSGNQPDPATSFAPYRIYNIGNSNPVQLMDYIDALEKALDKKAIINFMPMQPGDVLKSSADTTLLEQNFGYKPTTNVQEGIKRFVEWYLDYYAINR